MADYQTFTYIMYKEKEYREKAERERQERELQEEKRRQEAARKADENNAEKGPTNIKEIIRRQQERATKAKEKRSGNKSEENQLPSPPKGSRSPSISMEDLEEFFEEEM